MHCDEAYKWIEARTKQVCSPLARNVCSVLAVAGNGIYNAPITYRKADWSDDYLIEVTWTGEVNNWDFAQLTALWGMAAEKMLRIGIAGCGPNRLKLRFWQRSTRDGGVMERLPTAADQLAWVGCPVVSSSRDGENHE